MIVLVVFLLMIVVFGAIAAPIVFLQLRRNYREQKNFERGLKMVPLLIHLPPPSDDTAVNGRDTRDVNDETISKAQIIYNIIGSTLQKGFKSKFYGQRHFAFEIVGTGGFVYFYAAVPISMVEVVKQAVTSAYPSARLEEAAEHNIFSQVGKINATAGGELNLKESFAYPIATYQDLKRDALQSVLSSLSTLEKEDGAGIQILLRPADPGWRKKSNALAGKKRKGEDKKFGFMDFAKQIATALVKPPEEKKEGKPPKELSNLEQATLDAIDDKTRHQGYEVLIRIVTSSNISQRSQGILNNIVASFALFDAPGKNGFKFTATKNIEEFSSAYIMRFFPQNQNKNILNSIELATLFHFPDGSSVSSSQVTRQESKQVDGPRNVPDSGLLLGYNVYRGVKKPIRIALGDRQRHMYVVGQTGTGKSTFLENLAFQDMVSGGGFAFVDPHGDTAEKLLSMIPRERTEDVIYFSPSDMDFPMGLNLFEYHNADQKDFLIQEALNMLQKLYDPQHSGIMGPRYEHIFRNAALLIMADPQGGTFVDIPKLFRDPQFLKQKLAFVKDNTVREFWEKEFPASQRSNDAGEVTSWFVSKFGAFLSNEMMRNIIGQTKSAFDLRDIMDNKKILLVNLSKGRLGDLNSKLLGMIFVMKFQAAAMSRADIPEEERVDFSLYVDEFQNFSTDSFATIMSEARKYRLNLLVGNQFTTQLTPEIRDAVFGNMGTIVSFRIGQNDVESLGKYFQPTFDADDLLRVPNYNAIVRTLIGGVPTQSFSMATLPPFGTPNPKLAEALKQLSGAKFGRPRAVVEKEIFARMATVEPPKPAFGAPAAGSPFGTPAAGAAPVAGRSAVAPNPGFGQVQAESAASTAPLPAGASGTSFLDEWLTKRQTTPARPPAAPQPTGPPPLMQSAPANSSPSGFTPPASPWSSVSATPVSASPTTGAVIPNVTPQLTTPVVNATASQGDTAIVKEAAEPAILFNTETQAQEVAAKGSEANEVANIAEALKREMAAMQAESPTVPESMSAPEESVKPVFHMSDKAEMPSDDTIFIDNDGNLKQNSATTGPATDVTS